MMSTPSITLIGPGAIGAALAGGLVEAGHTPTLVTRTPFDRLRVDWPLRSVDVAARCVTAVDDIEPADVVIVATKATQNAAVGGIGVLTRRGSDVFFDIDALSLLQALMEEVAAVGRAEGAVLPDELPAQLRRYQEKNAGGHTTSIVVDRLAGQPTEWRERNQAVVDAAECHGIDVPLNQTVATLMRLGEPRA